MEHLLDLIKPLGFWGAAFAALYGYFFFWHFSKVVTNEVSRKWVVGWLLQDTASKRYRRLLTHALDWLDGKLSATEIGRGREATSARVAWSADLLGFNLTLALAYPALSLLLAWTISGVGNVGETVVIPAHTDAMARYGVAATVCGLALGYVFVRITLLRSNQLVGYTVVLTLASLVAGAFAEAVAGAVVVVVAVAGAGALAVAGAVAVAGALAVAFAVAGALAGAVAGAGAGEGAVAGALALAVAVPGAIAVDAISNRLGRQMESHLAWAIAGTGLVLAAILITPEFSSGPDGPSGAGFILFVSLLPLINALADFASCGLTRFWLRKGTDGNLMWIGLRDALAGAIIFVALGIAIIAAIHFVRPQDGRPLFDLASLFSGLLDPATRGNYWWLGMMLFSTLLPTLAHATIAVASLFTLAPEKWRHRIADWLHKGSQGDDIAGKTGRLALCALVTLSIWLPALALCYAFTLRHGVLDWAIALFHGFAVWIGAVPPLL